MRTLPGEHLQHSAPDEEAASGFGPEVIILLLTVAGAILFLSIRVLGGAS